jgi:hypothetical protein
MPQESVRPRDPVNGSVRRVSVSITARHGKQLQMLMVQKKAGLAWVTGYGIEKYVESPRSAG